MLTFLCLAKICELAILRIFKLENKYECTKSKAASCFNHLSIIYFVLGCETVQDFLKPYIQRVKRFQISPIWSGGRQKQYTCIISAFIYDSAPISNLCTVLCVFFAMQKQAKEHTSMAIEINSLDYNTMEVSHQLVCLSLNYNFRALILAFGASERE